MSDRLLTKEELDKVTGDRRIESLHFVFPAIEAQDVKTHQIDKVEIRQAALKEVGEWLKNKLPHMCDPDNNFHVLIYYADFEAFLRGEMPE